jgi:hypothetical protein
MAFQDFVLQPSASFLNRRDLDGDGGSIRGAFRRGRLGLCRCTASLLDKGEEVFERKVDVADFLHEGSNLLLRIQVIPISFMMTAICSRGAESSSRYLVPYTARGQQQAVSSTNTGILCAHRRACVCAMLPLAISQCRPNVFPEIQISCRTWTHLVRLFVHRAEREHELGAINLATCQSPIRTPSRYAMQR